MLTSRNIFRIVSILSIAVGTMPALIAPFGTSAHVLQAQEGVTLESLPAVQMTKNYTYQNQVGYNEPCTNAGSCCANDRANVSILTATHPGYFNNQRINRGLQFLTSSSNGTFCSAGRIVAASVTYQLNGGFDALVGTLYYDDSAATDTPLTISMVDDVGKTVELWSQTVGKAGQISVNVGGLRSARTLIIGQYSSYAEAGGGGGDIAARNDVHIVDLVATLLRPRLYVDIVYPLENTVLPSGANVAFVWKPFPGAVNYALHITMMKQQGKQVITSLSRIEFATLVHNRVTYTWNDSTFPRGTYQYGVTPLDSYGNPLGQPSLPVQISLT